MSLLDRGWEKIQQKTFTRWMNSYAQRKGFEITDLQTDFEDGIKLVRFMESISGENLGKINNKPRIIFQKIENINKALQFIEASGIPVRSANIQAEDIQEGNLKLLLGLVWLLILRFQVQDISEGELRAKEALLLWCQRKTEPYDNVSVDNFHKSFQDGLAFCALIHAHRPGLIPYDELTSDDPYRNLNLAFDVAEEHLGISKLLDAEDIVESAKPDERSIIAYVSQLYHVFSQDREIDTAARRVKNLVDFLNLIDNLKNEFNGLASDLLDWIKNKTEYMVDRNTDGTMEDILSKIGEMNDYKNGEKPEKETAKAELAALLNNLNMKLKNNGREPWIPEEDLTPENLENLWNVLGEEEVARDEWLQNQLKIQGKLKFLNNRFDDKASALEKWIAAKEDYLGKVGDDEPVNSLSEAQRKLKRAQAFTPEYESSEKRLTQVQDLGKQIVELEPPNADEIENRVEKITTDWQGLDGLHKAKLEDLEEKLAQQKRIDELRHNFASKVQEYENYTSEKTNDLGAHEFGNTLEEVQNFGDGLDEDDASVTEESKGLKDELDDIWNELQELGATNNPYTPLTNEDVAKLHETTLNDLVLRREAYEKELQRQLEMEAKRKEFAEAAEDFVQHLESRKEEINQPCADVADPDEAIESIETIYDESNPENEKLAHLENLANELSSLGVRNNPHTQHTMPSLKRKKRAFDNYVRNKIQMVHDEKELKEEYTEKATDLTEWVEATIPTLEKEFDNTLEGAEKIYGEWNFYKSAESAAKLNEQASINSLFNKIEKLLSQNGRPEPTPPEGLSPSDIQEKMDTLATAESEAEASIREELKRQEKIDNVLNNFNSALARASTFVESKEQSIGADAEVESLDDARLQLKLLDIALSDVEGKRNRLDRVNSLAEELNELDYHSKEEVSEKAAELTGRWEALSTAADGKREVLDAALAEQQAKEDLRLQFAELARDYNRFVNQSKEEITNHYFGETLKHIEECKANLDEESENYRNKSKESNEALDAADSALTENGIEDNKHTKFSLEDLKNLEEELEGTLQERDNAYEEELASQNEKDQKRQEWAAAAEAFVEFIEGKRGELNNLEGAAEEKLASISEIYGSAEVGAGKLAEVVELQTSLNEEGIFGNDHTALNVGVLTKRNAQYDTFVENYITALNREQELEARKEQQDADLKAREELEEKIAQFESKQREIEIFLDDADDHHTDEIDTSSVATVEQAQQSYLTFAEAFGPTEELLGELTGLAAEVEADASDVADRFAVAKEDSAAKIEALENALTEQKEIDAISQEFATAADAFNEQLDENRAATNAGATLEETIASLSQAAQNLVALEGDVENLETLNKQLEEKLVFDNSYTKFNFRSLSAAYDTLVASVNSLLSDARKELDSQSDTGISAEDLAAFRKSFDHFDKDKDGKLSDLDLYGVLRALEEDIDEGGAARLIQELDSDGDNLITFEEFSAFMVSKRADQDSPDQLRDAFGAVAAGKDFVTEADLRKLLSAEQVEYLLKTLPPYEVDGNVVGFDYAAFVNAAF
eukprot:TRINITY_DN3269_c0_g1_i1.p1 TRINITY_DN3269_c0_g1~~TRINITY_DN3269_c0_g1_i1.p1  ORF type:complete len:1533 (+),score=617.45 TRINITY_DN3269_c0_g1_i1:37-4635(+)